MAKTIVVGDDDLVITVRNERIEKIAGEVVYAEPVLRVLVGNTPIGMRVTTVCAWRFKVGRSRKPPSASRTV